MTVEVAAESLYVLITSDGAVVSAESAYGLLTYDDLVVSEQSVSLAIISPDLSVAEQTAYIALFSGDRATVSVQTVYIVMTSAGGSVEVAEQSAYIVMMYPPSNLYQDDNLIRPNYENTPVDNIVFDVGESLKVNILYPGTFTLILLRPDLSFLETEVVLVAGVNTLSLTDFNQLAILRGSPPEILKNSIRQTMLTRI